MDVILHVGAHRTGTTSFQHYLRAHGERLAAKNIGFWGPWRTRRGLFHGLAERPMRARCADRAAGRVRMNLAMTARRGTATLVVSDENLIGTARRNLQAGSLYPEIGERMARVQAAFGPVRRVALQIRAQDAWWASAIAWLVPRGLDLPGAGLRAALARSDRRWQHVITDLACACPDAEIVVTPFERFAGRPDRLLRRITGARFLPVAREEAFWYNRAPDRAALHAILAERGSDTAALAAGDGRYRPFDGDQAAAMRESYADDLFWLRAGADGLATLTEDPEPERPAIRLASGLQERGRPDDRPARRLAPTR
jgi:hypothetical protein